MSEVVKTNDGHWQITCTHYVITFNPSDFPGLYVVREWLVQVEGDIIARGLIGTAETLDQARDFIPDGYFKMSRHLFDDPVIVETWL